MSGSLTTVAAAVTRRLTGLLRERHVGEVLRGAGVALGLRGGAVLAGYAFMVVISRAYGAHGAGIYGLSQSILSLGEIVVGLGFGMASVRLVPEYAGQGRLAAVKRAYVTMQSITCSLALLVSAGLALGSHWVAAALFRDPALAGGLLAAAAALPFVASARISVETLRGFRRLLLSEYLRDFNTLVVALLGALFLGRLVAAESLPVWCYGAGAAVSAAVACACLTALFLRQTTAGTADGDGWRTLLALSLPMMATQFMTVYLGRIETLLLGWLASTREVGLYSVAFKLASVTNLLVTSVNMIGAPKISELYWSGDRPGLVRTVRLCSALMFWTSIPIIAVLMLTSRVWLGLLGQEFEAGRGALLLIAAGQVVNALCGPTGVFLNMTGRQRVFRNIVFAAVVVNVLTGLLAIPRLGIVGAALASMVALVLVNVLAAGYVWRKDRICTVYLPFIRLEPPETSG